MSIEKPSSPKNDSYMEEIKNADVKYLGGDVKILLLPPEQQYNALKKFFESPYDPVHDPFPILPQVLDRLPKTKEVGALLALEGAWEYVLDHITEYSLSKNDAEEIIGDIARNDRIRGKEKKDKIHAALDAIGSTKQMQELMWPAGKGAPPGF